MRIRKATHLDREGIRAVHASAFADSERELVAGLATNLLSESTRPATIALVAEADNAIVGHVGLSPLMFRQQAGLNAYILAPLGVTPRFQRRRIASALVENAKTLLTDSGVNALFVYGDPAFYDRFGFSATTAAEYLPPYELDYPFGWQAVVLNAFPSSDSRMRLSCVASLCDPNLW